MFRARRSAVLGLCIVVAYGLQLSAAVAAPPQGLPPCRDDHPAHVDLLHLPPCQPDGPPAEQPPVEQPPAEEPATDQPTSNELPPCTEDHPAAPDLTDLPPCQDETPGEEPPLDEEQPVEVSPVEEPPAEPPAQPPASNDFPPCTEDHPAAPDLTDFPPCQNQVADEENPAAGDPPSPEQPPAEEPPGEQTADDQPEPTAPDNQPASNELPPCTEDHPAVPDLTDLPPCQDAIPEEEPPAAEQQPAEVPPSEEPLAEEPPADEASPEAPTADEPPAEEPSGEGLPARGPEEPLAPEPTAEPTPADPAGTSPPTVPAAAPTNPGSGDDLAAPDLQLEPAEQAASSVPIELTTRAGSGLTIDISNFVHEGSGFTTLAYVAPTNGTLSIAGLVAIYTPNPGFYGVDAFTLRVCDSSAVCVDIAASVTVPPINDFLLTTGAALAKFFSAGGSTPTTYNELDLLPDTAQRVMVPLAGLAALVGASLLFGLDSVGSVLRRLLAVLAIRS